MKFPLVALGVACGRLERGRGAVDAQHFARTAARGAHSPGAHIAEYVQHSRAAAHVLRQRPAVGRLIEKPSGLLTLRQGRSKLEAVLRDPA